MDKRLFNELAKDNPVVINEKIATGLPYHTLKSAKEDVDKIIRIAASNLPGGFSFNGSTVCNPQEAYRVLTGLSNKSSTRDRSIDFAENDFYLAKYHFSLPDEELTPRYQMLPLVEKGSIMKIGGRHFTIYPVLGDRCFSIGSDNVFIRLSRAVVTFRNVYHTLVIDGHTTARILVWSLLHNRGGSQATGRGSERIKLGHVYTTMSHYLFAKYGLVETFKKFMNVDITLLREHEVDKYLSDNKLKRNDHHVITSKKVRPIGFKHRVVYSDMLSDLAVIVSKEEATPEVIDSIASIFYMSDFYPDEIDIEELKGSWKWKVWLGYLLFGDTIGNNRLVENVETHLNALDDYVDEGIRHLLMEEEGLEIDNFYELCWYMVVNMKQMLSQESNDISSMYGKSLLVNNYVLAEIRSNIFKMMFAITNNPKKVYTAKDYNRQLGIQMQHAILTRLRRTSDKPFMSTASLPGDNMIFQLGIKVIKQDRTKNRGRQSNRMNVNDPANRLDASILEAGNYLVLPKKTPTGDNTINPTVLLDSNNTIRRKPHLKEMIDYVASVISRD